ncbi:MAG TPA: proton-conducting transporter membrane subunit [Gammaproteobacteria bacterium]|nr:proton-conducting transporter membrane subunit [Gammaproteobacteria bacterium]
MTALASQLLPLAVLLPLGVAFLLLMLAHWLPPRTADATALVFSLLLVGLCGWLASQALHGPILHWFGGWTPATSHQPDVVLGIAFSVDPMSAAMAAFCALIFSMSFVFAWGYFDKVHAHFHILMLLFLAAMIGFCLTRDLFNLFVWFELMSIAAFALTAYPLEKSSLEGALNFTVTNALGSFLMLAGVALLYASTGTLDFVTMGRIVAHKAPDPVIAGGFCLIAAALLTKAAIVPFHMWLSDAHAVAPSPVSVIFSGVMVGLGLFGLLKVITIVFARDAQVMALVHIGLLWLGIATAVVGGLMAWAQRHLKRLLAFSTISHLGIMLLAVAAVNSTGAKAFLLYFVGHGLVKGTLFMVAGILLARFNSIDELELYGKGKRLWPAGVVMGVAGLLLGGLPWGILHDATDHVHLAGHGIAPVVAIIIGTSLTGAAVLRATLRIFAGSSGVPGIEFSAPTEREREQQDRPLWLMLLPCVVMLAIALLPASLAGSFTHQAATALVSTTPTPSEGGAVVSAIIFALTILIPAASLLRRRATHRLARLAAGIEAMPLRALQTLHSGRVTDYVVWMMVGLATLAGLIALR